MEVLHEERFTLETNREHVWELITSLDLLKTWLLDLESAKLLYGREGKKGAKVQLNFRGQNENVIAHIKRSEHLVRLQIEFHIADCRYKQIFNISGITEQKTSLLYFCHQDSPTGWRQFFSKAPTGPSFLHPVNLENLERILGREAMATPAY